MELFGFGDSGVSENVSVRGKKVEKYWPSYEAARKVKFGKRKARVEGRPHCEAVWNRMWLKRLPRPVISLQLHIFG